MSRLARFIYRLQYAAVALNRDDNAALEALRLVNRELLVTAFAEIPPDVRRNCDVARHYVIEAIRVLDPLPPGAVPKVDELPPAEHRELVARNSTRFGAVTNPPGQS